MDRYVAQHRIVIQIVDVFDKCESNEPNEEESQRVIDLMQEMQTFGNPPEGMMKTLVPGMDSGANGEEAMPSECKNM
jgi:peroxin-19